MSKLIDGISCGAKPPNRTGDVEVEYALKGTTAELAALKARTSILESVCGEAYQMAGQVGAAERILDNLSDAANGRPLRHETFLPVTDDDFSELTALKTRNEELERDRAIVATGKTLMEESRAHDIAKMVLRLEALEKWGRDIVKRGTIQVPYGDDFTFYCNLCGNTRLHYDNCPMIQARTLGLVGE